MAQLHVRVNKTTCLLLKHTGSKLLLNISVSSYCKAMTDNVYSLDIPLNLNLEKSLVVLHR